MNKNYIEYIAVQDLTTYHYKILLLLGARTLTQAQLCETLNVKKQNLHKYIKELETMNLIEVDRIEGRNKFYRSITNVNRLTGNIKGQTKIDM